MDIQLSIGLGTNPRTQAILDGRVKPDGIDFVCTPVFASELFWRQLHFAEFDVSEMSMSSLMMAVASGDRRWVGIPVFTTRKMFHTGIIVRKDRGIEKPADLKGKKIGVPEYQQTAALWTRGILQHEHGVHPSDIGEWWMERNPEYSHGGKMGFKAPDGVKLSYIPNSTNMGEMLLEGKLDGTILYLAMNNLVDRSQADITKHPDFKYIFPDPHAEGVRYYNATGIYPINHGMVIKREVAEKHPWAVLNIYKAFEQANELAEKERLKAADYHLEAGLLPVEAKKALATPLVRYGIRANRKVLETAAQYSFEQGLTPRPIKLEELFAPSAMEQ